MNDKSGTSESEGASSDLKSGAKNQDDVLKVIEAAARADARTNCDAEKSFETEYDVAWFKDKLGHAVKTLEWAECEGAGFTSGRKKVKVVFEGGKCENLIVKAYLPKENQTVNTVDANHVLAMGLAREADFYNFLKNSDDPKILTILRPLCPKPFYAISDWSTGKKIIIMEDLTSKGGVLCSFYYSPHSPFNWGRDLEALTKDKPNLSQVEIARATFIATARMHAAFWNDQKLLDIHWLQGSEWRKERSRDSWERSMEGSREAFKQAKQQIESGTYPMAVSDELFQCVKTLYDRLTWENYVTKCKRNPFTLIHDDLQPANIMWMHDQTGTKDPSSRIRLIDWENQAVGSGPREIGTYPFAFMDFRLHPPAVFKELVNDYYDELTKANPVIGTTLTRERCWQDFVYGGFEKYLWLMPLIGKWSQASVCWIVLQLELFRRNFEIDVHKIGALQLN